MHENCPSSSLTQNLRYSDDQQYLCPICVNLWQHIFSQLGKCLTPALNACWGNELGTQNAFLFGASLLVLITSSFWWYGRRTEDLVYKNTQNTGRAL